MTAGPLRSRRVLLADDDAALRTMLGLVLSLEHDFEVVGEAANGTELIRVAGALDASPDLLLLDASMPGAACCDVASAFRRLHPSTRIVVHSGHSVADLRTELADVLPDRIVQKGAAPTDLCRTLREVMDAPAAATA